MSPTLQISTNINLTKLDTAIKQLEKAQALVTKEIYNAIQKISDTYNLQLATGHLTDTVSVNIDNTWIDEYDSQSEDYEVFQAITTVLEKNTEFNLGLNTNFLFLPKNYLWQPSKETMKHIEGEEFVSLCKTILGVHSYYEDSILLLEYNTQDETLEITRKEMPDLGMTTSNPTTYVHKDKILRHHGESAYLTPYLEMLSKAYKLPGKLI